MKKVKKAGARFGGRTAKPLDRETFRFRVSLIVRSMQSKNEKGSTKGR